MLITITKTIKLELERIRIEMIQKIEIKANRAGIKILIPLSLTMIPALLLILIGPAILDGINTL